MLEHFLSFINEEIDGCWIFLGPWDGAGYGLFSYKGFRDRAHRISWILHKGDIQDGKSVLHTCDNRPCCNPDHLWLGSQQDNIDDMIAKGRAAIGEANGQAKLNDAAVTNIKKLLDNNLHHYRIAEMYNVDERTIRFIRDGITWRHVL